MGRVARDCHRYWGVSQALQMLGARRISSQPSFWQSRLSGESSWIARREFKTVRDPQNASAGMQPWQIFILMKHVAVAFIITCALYFCINWSHNPFPSRWERICYCIRKKRATLKDLPRSAYSVQQSVLENLKSQHHVTVTLSAR